MLDVVYYPVSALLRFWHHLIGLVLDPAGGAAWMLAVAMLVFTLRAALLGPALAQVRSQRTLRDLKPELDALRQRHADDRAALAAATHDLHRAHGISPLLGCLPALVQGVVFFGLFHVLRSFNRTVRPLWMTAADNAATPNYAFGAINVQSFLHAKLAGAPLAASITSTGQQLTAYPGHVTTPAVLLVAVPLMVLAAIATHLTARTSLAGQPAPADRQSRVMRVVSLWVFPAGALVGGPFLPVAVLGYWLSNNLWTLGQQYWAQRKAVDGRPPIPPASPLPPTIRAPRPGVRPSSVRRRRPRRRR